MLDRGVMVRGMHVEIREHDGEVFLDLMAKLLEHRGEFIMSQVQFSATFTVAPGAQPLTVTPATASLSLTVGVAVPTTPIAAVAGGVPPYTASLDAASGPLPTGVTMGLDASGTNVVLSGTPTVAGTSATPVLLDVSDSA